MASVLYTRAGRPRRVRTAATTADAAKDLGLKAGSPVVALIKATEVSLAAA
ncbi:TOBE domain-containing protein [Streptomyces sp. NPDC059918]|uniref:TOBE domain-containing protein n=1 Tax=unclassified Streptomyces TaxID=2593676 RepID=UPI0036486371